MAASYRRICKKLLQQKQSADKRTATLHMKVNNLEKDSIELESLKTKYDELARENFYLDLEVRGFKKSLDTGAMKNLETKSKFELVNEILTLMSQVAVLENTNTELWIDKKKLLREVERLKLSPLSKICCESKDLTLSHIAEPATEELSSILSRWHEDTPWNSFDDSFMNAEDSFMQKEDERRKFVSVAKASPILFSTPVKNLKAKGNSPRSLAEINWLPTPPVAVIPPWCILSSDESTLTPSNRSVDVSTMITDETAEDTIPRSSRNSPSINRSVDTSTMITDESSEDTVPSSSRTCSTTYKQIKED